MRAKAISATRTGFHIDEEEPKLFQIAMVRCQIFGGWDLATRIGKVRLETRARGAPEFWFCERKICEISVGGPPVNLGLSPLLHPKPQPCSTRNGREKIPNRTIRILKLLHYSCDEHFWNIKSLLCFLTQLDGQNPCPKWLGCGGVPAGLTPSSGGNVRKCCLIGQTGQKGLDYFEANMGLELQPDRVCAVLPKPEMISRRR